MTVAVLLAAVLGTGMSLTLDSQTIGLVNSVINFLTLFILWLHKNDVRLTIKPKVDRLEETLAQAVPGGRRQMDPPVPGDQS